MKYEYSFIHSRHPQPNRLPQILKALSNLLDRFSSLRRILRSFSVRPSASSSAL